MSVKIRVDGTRGWMSRLGSVERARVVGSVVDGKKINSTLIITHQYRHSGVLRQRMRIICKLNGVKRKDTTCAQNVNNSALLVYAIGSVEEVIFRKETGLGCV